MRTLLALGIVLAVTAAASADFFDNFDSYADQAAFEAVWPQYGTYGPMALDQTFGYSDGQSAKGDRSASYTVRSNHYLDTPHVGTAAQPLVFEFQQYISSSATPWNARCYSDIHALDDVGGLESIIAMGMYNAAPADPAVFQGRVGFTWVNLTVDRIFDEWVSLKAVIAGDMVDFFVNGAPAGSFATVDGRAYDRVVLGSGLTAGGCIEWNDDVSLSFIPEPSALSLLVLGGLALLRRR